MKTSNDHIISSSQDWHFFDHRETLPLLYVSIRSKRQPYGRGYKFLESKEGSKIGGLLLTTERFPSYKSAPGEGERTTCTTSRPNTPGVNILWKIHQPHENHTGHPYDLPSSAHPSPSQAAHPVLVRDMKTVTLQVCAALLFHPSSYLGFPDTSVLSRLQRPVLLAIQWDT